ncbi:MAG: hypothetical protein V4604_15100 [Bacteroidota bacterium]
MKTISLILLLLLVRTGIGQSRLPVSNTVETDTIQPVRPPFYNKIDSTRRQIAASAFFVPQFGGQFYSAGLEINLPARKYGWFNSFSVQFINNSKSIRQLAHQSNYSSLMAGKKYEWINVRTYFSLGLSVGGFWNYRNITTFRTNIYGLAFVPHLEVGLNLRRVVIAFGGKFAVSGGYFESRYFGSDPLGLNFRSHGTEAFIAISPYVKILLK